MREQSAQEGARVIEESGSWPSDNLERGHFRVGVMLVVSSHFEAQAEVYWCM